MSGGRWYDSSDRRCATEGCSSPTTPRTEFCTRCGAAKRKNAQRARVRVEAEIVEQDIVDKETLQERLHWYRGAVRIDDPDVVWSLRIDEAKCDPNWMRRLDDPTWLRRLDDIA